MQPAEDFGFLMTASGGLLYFHRNSVLNGDFDRLEVGDEVRYIEEMGDTGPIAQEGARQSMIRKISGPDGATESHPSVN